MLNDALSAAVLEVERFVAAGGWDQRARLFALVPTAELLAAMPELDHQLSLSERPEDHFSSIEQDDFVPGDDLVDSLAHLAWPATVAGCVLALERLFLPASAELEIPEDPEQAAAYVAAHSDRKEMRVVAGVLRDGSRSSVARVRDLPDELLGGTDLVPALSVALLATLD